MSDAFIYFSISLLLILLFFLCLKCFVGGCTPRKVLRGVDNALSKSRLGQVFMLAFLIVFIFTFIFFICLGVSSLCNDSDEISFWNALGHFFNAGNFNKADGIANGWVLIINVFGMILMTGLLISVLSNLLERRVDNIENGRITYNFKKHFVIIGFDKMTIGLVRQLHELYKDAEIVIQTIQEVPIVRHELFSYVNGETEKKLIIVSGNRNSKEDIEKLNLDTAEEVFILGEENETDHDSLNIECLKIANTILSNSKTNDKIRKRFHVLFENQSTYAVLQQQNVEVGDLIEFVPFDFQEKWAEKIFVNNESNYLPLDRVPIREESLHTVHLVIVGMSKMGVALGIEATHLCHFPNFVRDKKLKTKITFIDKNADKEMYFLQGRYQSLFNEIDYEYEDISNSSNNKSGKDANHFTDIEWHFIKGEIENPVVQEKIGAFSEEKNVLLTIAICLNNPSAAIAAGLYLKTVVYDTDKVRHFEQYSENHTDVDTNLFNVQILIKQNTPHTILSMLEHTDKYQNVKAFGMVDDCLNVLKSDNRDVLAKRVHYVYDYYYGKETHKQIPTSIPDTDVLNEKWLPMVIAEKWSNRYHANMIAVKLRSFNLEELVNKQHIELLAKVEHNRWNIEKLLLGFRPTKDSEKHALKSDLKKKFIHPDVKPFDELSDDMKDLDRMISEALPLINDIAL